MKTVFCWLAMAALVSTVKAQTFCLAATDQCCDQTANSDFATTPFEIDPKVSYDACSTSNQLTVTVYVDNVLYDSWTDCGCGNKQLGVIGPGHVVKLEIKCLGCSQIQCVGCDGKAVLYDNNTSTACKLDCD